MYGSLHLYDNNTSMLIMRHPCDPVLELSSFASVFLCSMIVSHQLHPFLGLTRDVPLPLLPRGNDGGGEASQVHGGEFSVHEMLRLGLSSY